MKFSTLISSLVLAGTLAIGGALLAPTFAGESRTVSTGTNGERQWLSVPQIAEKLEAAGYRNIEKIERERGRYEVRATDRNGVRTKLDINPQTGTIGERRSHDKRAGGDDDGRQRASADCSKRRCRDDLPRGGSSLPTNSPPVPKVSAAK